MVVRKGGYVGVWMRFMVDDGDRLNNCSKVSMKEDSEGDGMCDGDGCDGWWG